MVLVFTVFILIQIITRIWEVVYKVGARRLRKGTGVASGKSSVCLDGSTFASVRISPIDICQRKDRPPLLKSLELLLFLMIRRHDVKMKLELKFGHKNGTRVQTPDGLKSHVFPWHRMGPHGRDLVRALVQAIPHPPPEAASPL